VVSNCVVMGNAAYYHGGGTYFGTIYSCTLTGNKAWYRNGGGAYGGALNNCALTGNSASISGGGAFGAALTNCALTGNSVGTSGGGAALGTLNNCTLTRNSSAKEFGGVSSATLNNCIVYYNTAALYGDNHNDRGLNYCCTTPLPTSGTGNLTVEPQLSGNWHLSVDSPCRGAGNAAYATGRDLDGEPWANPPSIGCDEVWSGSVTGPLSVAIEASYTNVAAGFAVDFQAMIGGRASASRWDFGDGTVVSNRPNTGHSWGMPGDYVVELRAFNESYPEGVTATATVRVAEAMHYVAQEGANPLPPYSSWTTAATNIQSAVDAATLPGALILVSNGVYQTGARAMYGMSNRVAVSKAVTIRSANGPEVTTIAGYQVPATTNGAAAVRCVYLATGAVLSGFTLTNGATQASGDNYTNQSGGAVRCESASAVVSNCVITGNSAKVEGGGNYNGTLNNCTLVGNSATYGGGAARGTLNHCILSGNSASQYGGGAYKSTLNNCVLTGNTANLGGGGVNAGDLNQCTLTGNSTRGSGGGASGRVLNNCIAYHNTAQVSGENYDERYTTLNHCCTVPLPGGSGNFTNAPLFVGTNEWSELRLQSDSPSINAGLNGFAIGSTDLDGNPRIVGGTVDIGAYEYQSPASQLSYAWLQQYGLPTDGSADFTDPDGDRANNWLEWQCATVPTNALSALRLLIPQTVGTNLVVSWESVSGKSYFLQRSAGLGTNASFLPLASGITGQAGTTTFTDTNAAPASPRFYRVGVE
jgi:hypothetical protein